MLSSCLRGYPLPRRSPLCLSDSARQFDRTPLVWLVHLAASVSSRPGEAHPLEAHDLPGRSGPAMQFWLAIELGTPQNCLLSKLRVRPRNSLTKL